MSWEKGRHDDHEVVVIEVRIRRDAHGRVVSNHFPQDETDLSILEGWPSGGMEQVAFALLTEAVRREALLDVILQASADVSAVRRWRNGTEEERGLILDNLTRVVRSGMDGGVGRIAASALRSALDLVSVPSPT
jgi:hypothetical protein